MSVAAVFTVPDAAATPVTHSFNPVKMTGDYALWEDRLSGVYAGFGKFSVQMKRPENRDIPRGQRGRNIQIRQLMEFPQLEIISGASAAGYVAAPGVAYRPTVETIWKLPEQCPLQVRKDLWMMYLSALNLPFVKAITDSYDMPS
jgi:hypothetical protein